MLRRYITSTASILPLVVLRILVGLVGLLSTIRFMVLGWVDDHYVRPVMHFSYDGFDWVPIPPQPWLDALFVVMALAALGIVLGAWFRITSILFVVLFTWVFLFDKAYYLNHYYFIIVVATLLAMMPAHRAFSVDVLRKPSLRVDRVPRWMVDVFKLQVAIVYIYAGIAKINAPWLLDAMPLRIWLPAHDTMPVIGPLLAKPLTAYVFAWFGMVYDCTIVFFLMHRRTKWYAFGAVVVFHLCTATLFQIGVFPYVMIGMSTIFLVDAHYAHDTVPVPRTIGVLAAFILVQVLLPLRPYFYPGNMFWHEQGFRFGWRVMLMEKAATATFYVMDGEGGRANEREGVVVNSEFLNDMQERQMSTQPDMILQYAHKLAAHYRARGMRDPHVRAEVYATLNAAPGRLLVDPTQNLAVTDDGCAPYAWVTP
ncbi:MAG: HTTM domain-containing protein [Bacteroidetes bacterium]|nr:HTTM domain-containing protein [Bacteroidota bacterium]